MNLDEIKKEKMIEYYNIRNKFYEEYLKLRNEKLILEIQLLTFQLKG